MKSIILALMMIVGLSQSLLANEVGPAGCGLGNQFFKKDMQILAATTNGSSGTQTFGITSGTSNCGTDQHTAQMIMFVESNRIALANDSARGQGETLSALSELMGCRDSKVFGQTLQNQYQQIFEKNSENSIGISKAIRDTVRSNPSLAQSCHPIG